MGKKIIFFLLLTLSVFGQDKYWFYYWNQDGTIYTEAPPAGRLTLTANTDTVLIGGYFAVNTGTTNWGNTPDLESMNYGMQYRIRQNCTISKFDIYIKSLTDVTALYLRIWSYDGITWDSISQSENFLSQVSALTTNTVRLTTPINANEGNYYSILSIGSNGQEFQVIADAANLSYYLNRRALDGEAWLDAPAPVNYGLRINMYTTPAPLIVWIGNSLTSSPDGSYLETATPPTVLTGSTVAYKVGDSLNYTYQNMGSTGQTSTQGLARFGTDVVNLHPKIAVIEFLLNDINGGAAVAEIVANYTAMLDSCVAYDIYPILWLPTSWTAGTNAQMLKLDSAVVQLKALPYTMGIADDGFKVGVERDTGTPTPTAGNHWNIDPTYSDDGTHRNTAGNILIANQIDSVILRRYLPH